MDLGVATHFAQGWSLELVQPAQEIGVDLIRDGLTWRDIEQERNIYVFSGPRARYPDRIASEGIELRLVFAQTNPLYDDDTTPHTDEARAGFAEFVFQSLRRNPFVRTIEIGNEFNAQSFLSGVVLDAPYEERAAYYVDLLKAVHARISVEFPEVEIIAGAAHSIPIEFLKQQVALGALEYSDGLAVHPYTSPPEKVGAHLDMLRAAIAPADPAIHATEFGGDFNSFEEAGNYLVKMTTALSASGVDSAIWYALREENGLPRMELLDFDGVPRPSAASFEFVKRELLPRGDAVRLPSDPYTYLYSFGPNAVVAWGEPRSITIEGDVDWRDAEGNLVDAPGTLDPDRPIVALSRDGAALAPAIRLGPQGLIADSYHDFDPRLGPDGAGANWSYHAVYDDGTLVPLTEMGGGERQSEAYRPYVGSEWLRPLGISEDIVGPVDFSTEDTPGLGVKIRERFVAPADTTATLCGVWRVNPGTVDGVTLRIALDGEEILDEVVNDTFSMRLDDMTLVEGQTLDIITGTNADPTGDTVERRVKIARPAEADQLCETSRNGVSQ